MCVCRIAFDELRTHGRRQDFGCTIPLACPKALLQLDTTCFPLSADSN